MYIDTHQHFWYYNPTDFGWIDNHMEILQRNFLPPDLEKTVDGHSIQGTVAVQAMTTELETHFLVNLAQKHDIVQGVVGWIDIKSESIELKLEQFAQMRYLKGFRLVLQDKDPAFMAEKDFRKTISLLDRYGFTYDLLLFPHHLEAAIDLVKAFPNQHFVIDHMAKPYIKDGQIDTWGRLMSEISRTSENVYCKVSGLVTEADWNNWKEKEIHPYLDVVFESFGCDRLMYGSDWPVCLLASDYQRVLTMLLDYLNQFSSQEKMQVMRDTAVNFYSLD